VLADQRGGDTNDFEIAGHGRFRILCRHAFPVRLLFVLKLPGRQTELPPCPARPAP
jgi:hypothetical protein